MKIGNVQGFGARFTPDSYAFLADVKKQAQMSGRMEEYSNAKKILAYNFPQGVIRKEKSYRHIEEVFSFNPNQAVQFSFKPNGSPTNELDSFIKLAKEVRKISL